MVQFSAPWALRETNGECAWPPTKKNVLRLYLRKTLMYICLWNVIAYQKMKIIYSCNLRKIQNYFLSKKIKNKFILYYNICSSQWQYLIGSICGHLTWGSPQGRFWGVNHLKVVFLPLQCWLHEYALWLMHCHLGPQLRLEKVGFTQYGMIYMNTSSKVITVSLKGR